MFKICNEAHTIAGAPSSLQSSRNLKTSRPETAKYAHYQNSHKQSFLSHSWGAHKGYFFISIFFCIFFISEALIIEYPKAFHCKKKKSRLHNFLWWLVHFQARQRAAMNLICPLQWLVCKANYCLQISVTIAQAIIIDKQAERKKKKKWCTFRPFEEKWTCVFFSFSIARRCLCGDKSWPVWVMIFDGYFCISSG